MPNVASRLTPALAALLLMAGPAATADAQPVTPLDPSWGSARDRAYSDDLRSDVGAPGYRELRCRGGGELRFETVDGRTLRSGEDTDYLTLAFSPAVRAAQASGLGLRPGQCAFADRALRTDEPNQLVLEIVAFGQLGQQLHGSAVDTSPTAAERFPDARNLPDYMSAPGHYWSFLVRQNAPLPSGRFEASSAGRFWKPASQGEDAVRAVDPNGGRDAPYFSPSAGAPAKALGRTRLPRDAPITPRMSVCDAARAARARNNVAAAGLEAQCRAVGETPSTVPRPIAPGG
jgi:hypothetical protein